MAESRANVISSFSIIKGSLVDETYRVFEVWDFGASKQGNLKRIQDENLVGAASAHWLRDVAKALNRRFDPAGRDRSLVELAQAGCDREAWKPLLLWHMTQDEFLLRDWLVNWLYRQHQEGAGRMRADDVEPYLVGLRKRKGIIWSGEWSEQTLKRVASGLLRMAADFGLLAGTVNRTFASYHLPDASFLYLLHAMATAEPNALRLVQAADWHMYLMDAADVERELLRLHQYRRLHYEVAGSLAQLRLPFGSALAFAREGMP